MTYKEHEGRLSTALSLLKHSYGPPNSNAEMRRDPRPFIAKVVEGAEQRLEANLRLLEQNCRRV